MPKADSMTPKALSNRMKSVGLQRLRWYCQMCQKQCRDENGFKCHMSSDGHLRLMKVFGENPGRYLSEFSSKFEKGFVQILSHRHGTKRVLANQIYQEYISEKDHVHMNATSWTSLSGFVQYLGREGKVIAEETEKGWFIQYIDRDPKILAKQSELEKRHQSEIDTEERQRRMIELQISEANRKRKIDEDAIDEDPYLLQRSSDNGSSKILVSFEKSKKNKPDSMIGSQRLAVFCDDDDDNDDTDKADAQVSHFFAKTSNTLSSLQKQDADRKHKMLQSEEIKCRKDYWLYKGIVVKIKNKSISDGQIYNKKGVVRDIIDKYVGEIQLEDGMVVRIDQDDLETVIPTAEGIALIVNGRGRGCRVVIIKINEMDYNCSVRFLEGPFAFMEIDVAYEDLSKISS